MKYDTRWKSVEKVSTPSIYKPNSEKNREAITQNRYYWLETEAKRFGQKQVKRKHNSELLETFLREGGEIRKCLTKTTNK